MTTHEKRKYLRISGFLEGTFESEPGVQGLIMLTNFTREGVGVALNRRVSKGTRISMEAWIPGSIVPVFARGEVVWSGPGKAGWTYPFEAGIRLVNIEREDVYRMLDYIFECWRTEQKPV